MIRSVASLALCVGACLLGAGCNSSANHATGSPSWGSFPTHGTSTTPGSGTPTGPTVQTTDAGVVIQGQNLSSIPGHETLALDNTPKESQRLLPAESLIRSYMALFGGLAPLPLQHQLIYRGTGTTTQNLFDSWDNYLGALGMPDYTVDIPRGTQTNSLMIAAFERIGVALCDRAIEHDLQGSPPPDISARVIFTFDLPTATTISDADFASRFDILHRTFLGYPAAMAPTDRINRFQTLYETTVANHSAHDAAASYFTPAQAGWAAVCYGLIRHPEFHLY